MTTNPFELAADRLRGRWAQHHYGDIFGNGPVCAVGAIAAVTAKQLGLTAFDSDAAVIFSTPLCRTYLMAATQTLYTIDEGDNDIPMFNDDPDTTEDDVLLLFKQAAIDWDEGRWPNDRW